MSQSHEKRNWPVNFEGPALTSIEEEKLVLLDIQAYQEHVLERDSIADKGREEQRRRQRMRIKRLEAAAIDPETRSLSKVPGANNEGATRLSVALLWRSSHGGVKIIEAAIKFTLSTPGDSEQGIKNQISYLPVARAYGNSADHLPEPDKFTPLGSFNSFDTNTVVGLLHGVAEERGEHGRLPHLENDLSAIQGQDQNATMVSRRPIPRAS